MKEVGVDPPRLEFLDPKTEPSTTIRYVLDIITGRPMEDPKETDRSRLEPALNFANKYDCVTAFRLLLAHLESHIQGSTTVTLSFRDRSATIIRHSFLDDASRRQ